MLDPQRSKPPLDLGHRFAQVVCVLLALLGAMPAVAEMLLRTDKVRAWASAETQRVLEKELGVDATYHITLSLVPLRLTLEDLRVAANDGKGPALVAREISITPKIFSLLGGRIDRGDISIDQPRARLVLSREGQLKNVDYRLPKSKGGSGTTQPPFTSLAVSDARVELEFGERTLLVDSADLDVFVSPGPTFEVALRTTTNHLHHQRPLVGDGVAHDEDIICEINLRGDFSEGRAHLRRLDVLAVADLDPRLHTEPSCEESKVHEDPQKLAIKASDFELFLAEKSPPRASGTIDFRSPVKVANRYLNLPKTTGWLSLAGELAFDGHSRLPAFKGNLKGADLGIASAKVAKYFEASLEVKEDVLYIPETRVGWANGDNVLRNTRIAPFEPGAPLSTEVLEGHNMTFPGIMRDTNVTPRTIVAWDLVRTKVTNIRATLHPFELRGELTANTQNFEVTDKAFSNPSRKHMVGVKNADIKSSLFVTERAFTLENNVARFGKSTLLAPLVSIGFNSQLKLVISDQGSLALEDISPLVDIPMSGTAKLSAKLDGDPQLSPILGKLSINAFTFGGFELGDIMESDMRFVPLKLDLSNLRGKKGNTPLFVSSARLSFDQGATLIADAVLQSDALHLRDFFAMFHFDEDPRFDPLSGVTKFKGKLHYALGGKEDACGGGRLVVDGVSELLSGEFFEERFDGGAMEFRYEWFDKAATYLGSRLEIPSFTLRKGEGTLFGRLSMEPGGKLDASIVGNGVPLSEVDALGPLGYLALGQVSGVGTVSGTVDEMLIDSEISVSPVTVGSQTLPASRFKVQLRPVPPTKRATERTRCGYLTSAPFAASEWAKDEPAGIFHVRGGLFGQQVALDDVQITRQRKKRVSGNIGFRNFDLGPWASLAPTVGESAPLRGKLSGKLNLQGLSEQNMAEARASMKLEALSIEQGPFKAELVSASQSLELEKAKLDLGKLVIRGSTGQTQSLIFDVTGAIDDIGGAALTSVALSVRPADLSVLSAFLPDARRVRGKLTGGVRVAGPWASLVYSGELGVQDGLLVLGGLPAPITDLNLNLSLSPEDLRIERGEAKMGGGSLRLSGGSEISQGSLRHARLNVDAENVNLPLDPGLSGTVDASLLLAVEGTTREEERVLPKLTGSVTLRRFEYTRPVSMTADIESLAQRSGRTEFDPYDPSQDTLDIDIVVLSREPIVLRNNLIDAQVLMDKAGLNLTGTNQRFGMRGALKLKPGGRIALRRNEFEIRQGTVRFNNPAKIAPEVDVTAVTEYRRYAQEDSNTATEEGDTSGATREGRWSITMHAHGDADRLKIDLTSDPPLGQDDIFLLLTVGLTRAELDQARSASVGESVALEALGALTGADRAVTDAVPVIDDLRFGSAYSSRSGRTQPTVTIGKRLAERIRANVTSGLGEAREVRSNVEWKLTPQLSVEGSYDNVNDISSSSLGNLGADIRWRIEFE